MKTDGASARVTLDRHEWIEAAIELLAEQGVQGMRVELLAKNFGVTKGSFYWHFKDRQDLVDGVLATWRDGRLRDIDKQTVATPGREREQLLHLIDVYGATRNRKGISIELAVREWARRDAQAAAIVEEVDTWRLECTRKLFVRHGVSEDEAKSRSLLLYAYVFGQSMMACERYDPAVGEFKRWIADLIVK
ncbi:MAG: TetR/AcrR family transcriptional regulator [Candidatus Accumulibacter sp.]|nr:TetR/AcrR family transcriptional regulator [Accumulibacter sp.]MCB1967309.1 TetR/AcrR family transcriptional regulator [Accumulibacter sp.]